MAEEKRLTEELQWVWGDVSMRGPAADGRWRETLVTQQSTLTGRLLCTLGTPPLCVCLCNQAGPGHSSQDSRLHGVSASPQENTHRASSHSPAAALDSHALPLCCLSSTSSLQHLTGFHCMPTTCMCLWACNVHGSQPPHSQKQASEVAMKCNETDVWMSVLPEGPGYVCKYMCVYHQGVMLVYKLNVLSEASQFLSLIPLLDHSKASVLTASNVCTHIHTYTGFIQEDFLIILKANIVPLYNVFPCFNGSLWSK